MKNVLSTADEIVGWLKAYAAKSGRKAWVVGVSGGVDSALVSTLCARTGMPVACVVLPCHSKPDQGDRAIKHISWLQQKHLETVEYIRIDLTKTFDAFKASLCGDFNNDLAFANTKSRLRMIALYQVATNCEGLVVGTGNKVEDFGIGFFTKYGDGGVDISPIADLLKSEVRQMCRELGVLPELCNAVPTDGLWDDTRTDESAIGATYEELEWAMQWLEESEGCYSTVILEGLSPRQKQVLEIYTKRHAASQHKLTSIPIFITKETMAKTLERI